MTYTKNDLRQIFQQPFNQEGWQTMLLHYFHATELRAERERIEDTDDEEQGYYLGAINTTDNYRIGLFYYQIQHGNVARKRVGLRNLVKSFINPNWGEFDAALVVFDSGSVWRLSFVCDIKDEKTAAKRFTYVFGESDNYYNTPVGRFDALQRNGISFENIKDAFSVERLNKDFFNGYKDYYKKFLEYIGGDTKENRDYVKKLLGRLVFLQFLQKKGWMGVPANQQGWNGGDKFYLNHLIDGYKGNDRLLSDILEPLFFNTLNEYRDNDLADSRLGDNIKIPYLNGGLFDKDELDKKDIDFPYDYFKGLMDFFAMYNFTIDENDPEDSEIGIDPEMLGHIFENLLEDNKDKGAFYTPKEIVQYMSKESVAQYLKSNTPEELHTAIDSLIKQRIVEPILQNKENARLVTKALAVVKVCDPAIGSGAFPMGVLNVLFDCRHLLYGFIGKNEDFSYAKVKRDIIQNNIYGVDIEKGAVDIARLRFWLALVVDENEPQPLPNLDYKIMCGDSLLHRFPLDAPFQNVLKDYNQKNGTHYTLDDYRQWVNDYTDISDHTQKDNFRQRIEDIKHAFKTELSDKEKGKIAKVRGTIENLKMEDLFDGKNKENEKKIKALQKELKALEQQREEIESNKIYDQAFEWRFEFPALLNDDGEFTGFDIIIGNPPYINANELKKILGIPKYNKLKSQYETAKGTVDFYIYFFEVGLLLLKSDGVLSFITPNKFFSANYGKALRDYLINNVCFVGFVDVSRNEIFDASVYPLITTFSKETATVPYNFYVVDKNNQLRWFSSSQLKFLPENIWGFMLCSDYSLVGNIINNSIPITEICQVNATSTASEADYFHGYITETNTKGKKLINTGTIDPFVTKWGKQRLIDKKEKFLTPYLPNDKSILGENRYNMYNSPKIIVAKMALSMEGIYDEKGEYSSINTNCFHTISVNPKLLLAWIHSSIFHYLYECFFEGLKMSGGYLPFSAPYLSCMYYPVNTNNEGDIIKVVDNILKEQNFSSDNKTKIDTYFYYLYGLTYDEVLIIDPETSITREEYNNNK